MENSDSNRWIPRNREGNLAELASAGAKVMITSRKAEACEEAVNEGRGELAFEAGLIK